MQSTHSLPSLQSSLWPGVVIPDRVRSIGQIDLIVQLRQTELFNIELFLHLTVCLNCVTRQSLRYDTKLCCIQGKTNNNAAV